MSTTNTPWISTTFAASFLVPSPELPVQHERLSHRSSSISRSNPRQRIVPSSQVDHRGRRGILESTRIAWNRWRCLFTLGRLSALSLPTLVSFPPKRAVRAFLSEDYDSDIWTAGFFQMRLGMLPEIYMGQYFVISLLSLGQRQRTDRTRRFKRSVKLFNAPEADCFPFQRPQQNRSASTRPSALV